MSFCQSCGSVISDQTTICPSCGAQRSVPGYTPVAAAPPGAAAPVAATTGLSENGAGALAYLLGLLSGVVFLVIDPYKNIPFVRFHAFQSIFFNIAWIVLWIVWSIVMFMLTLLTHGLFAVVGMIVNLLLGLGGLLLWLYLMYSAYKGKTFKLPVVGEMAAKQAGI